MRVIWLSTGGSVVYPLVIFLVGRSDWLKRAAFIYVVKQISKYKCEVLRIVNSALPRMMNLVSLLPFLLGNSY